MIRVITGVMVVMALGCIEGYEVVLDASPVVDASSPDGRLPDARLPDARLWDAWPTVDAVTDCDLWCVDDPEQVACREPCELLETPIERAQCRQPCWVDCLERCANL